MSSVELVKSHEKTVMVLFKKLSIKNKIRAIAFVRGLLQGQNEEYKLTGN